MVGPAHSWASNSWPWSPFPHCVCSLPVFNLSHWFSTIFLVPFYPNNIYNRYHKHWRYSIWYKWYWAPSTMLGINSSLHLPFFFAHDITMRTFISQVESEDWEMDSAFLMFMMDQWWHQDYSVHPSQFSTLKLHLAPRHFIYPNSKETSSFSSHLKHRDY